MSPDPAWQQHAPSRPRWRALPLAALALPVAALALLLASAPAAAGRGRPGRADEPAAHVRVVGGTAAAVGTWPWLAFVANDQADTACSGTVVSPMLVLTAAHCVEDLSAGTVAPASSMRVVTGALDWSDPSSGQVLGVSEVVVDPAFDATTLDDDAALLVLAAPTLAPAITLASPAESSLLTAGTPAEVAGWGYTYVGETTPPTSAYWGSMVVQSAAYCTQQETLDGVLFDPAENVCAVDDPSFAVAACHGDSGGPLVAVASDGTPIEIGITSHGDPNCDPSYPSVFTRADAVSGWVSEWIATTPAPSEAPPPATTPPATIAGAPAPTAAAAPSPPASATRVHAPAPRHAPASPGTGAFAGTTAQHGGSVGLTVLDAHLRAIRIEFALRCAHTTRARLHETASTDVPLTLVNRAWSFSDTFTDRRGWRYAIRGSFSSPARAAGTLSVRTRNGACRARGVRWSAGASSQ